MAEYKTFGKSEYNSQKEIANAIAAEAGTEELVMRMVMLRKTNEKGRIRKGYKVNPIFLNTQ